MKAPYRHTNKFPDELTLMVATEETNIISKIVFHVSVMLTLMTL